MQNKQEVATLHGRIHGEFSSYYSHQTFLGLQNQETEMGCTFSMIRDEIHTYKF